MVQGIAEANPAAFNERFGVARKRPELARTASGLAREQNKVLLAWEYGNST